jgi:mRNA-degrading endonuclease toxin of MazEF toxin-antitoxin module
LPAVPRPAILVLLAKRIGRLAPAKLRAVEDALRFALAL